MKIAAISDLHGSLLPEIPKSCNYLVIAGDLLPEENQSEFWEDQCIPWFKNLSWLKRIFLVGGNHDYYLEQQNNWQLYKNIQEHGIWNLEYLENRLYFEKDFDLEPECREYELKIYGSPCTTSCGYMAFSRNTLDFLDSIPENLDLLILHEAPVMEYTKHIFYEGKQAGNSKLNEIIHWKKPKILICGHVHYPCIEKIDGTLVCNVSRSTYKNILPDPVIIKYTGGLREELFEINNEK